MSTVAWLRVRVLHFRTRVALKYEYRVLHLCEILWRLLMSQCSLTNWS